MCVCDLHLNVKIVHRQRAPLSLNCRIWLKRPKYSQEKKASRIHSNTRERAREKKKLFTAILYTHLFRNHAFAHTRKQLIPPKVAAFVEDNVDNDGDDDDDDGDNNIIMLSL